MSASQESSSQSHSLDNDHPIGRLSDTAIPSISELNASRGSFQSEEMLASASFQSDALRLQSFPQQPQQQPAQQQLPQQQPPQQLRQLLPQQQQQQQRPLTPQQLQHMQQNMQYLQHRQFQQGQEHHFYVQNQHNQQQAHHGKPLQRAHNGGSRQPTDRPMLLPASMSPPLLPASMSPLSLPMQYPSPATTPIIIPSSLPENAPVLSPPHQSVSGRIQPSMSSSSASKRKEMSSAPSNTPNPKERKTGPASARTSEPSTSRGARRDVSQKEAHLFSDEQTSWLVTQLQDPAVCSVLQGERDSTNRKTPKARIYEQMVQDFNDEFGTRIVEKQIKNKVTKMLKMFREADAKRNESGFGNTPEADWRQVLEDICPFYFALEATWSTTFGEADVEPVDSLSNLDYGLIDTPQPRVGSPDWEEIDDDTSDNGLGHLDVMDEEGDLSYARNVSRRYDEDKEEQEDVEDEGEEDEEETLVRRTRQVRPISRLVSQPASMSGHQRSGKSNLKPAQKQQARETSIQGTQLYHHRRQQSVQPSTPAEVPAKSKKATELSIAEALNGLTDVSRGQLELAKEEAKQKHELALKRLDQEQELALKQQELALKQQELALKQQEANENEKKREHERKMMDRKLALLKEAKDAGVSASLVIESGQGLLRLTDIITEVVNSPESQSGSPPRSPTRYPKVLPKSCSSPPK